jgi:hypothetical protein
MKRASGRRGGGLTRRGFLAGALAAPALAIVPRHVLGGESSCRVGPMDPRGSAAATIRVGAKHPPYIWETDPMRTLAICSGGI